FEDADGEERSCCHVDTHSGIHGGDVSIMLDCIRLRLIGLSYGSLFVIDHGGILARQLYPECGCIVMARQTNGFAAMTGQINTFAAKAGQINTFAAKAGQMIRFATMGRVYNMVCLCLYFQCLKRKGP
ncbi:hypothetical protein Tco_0762491, partial [Tanacetum coccineum]